jgi:hypothetical protein
MSDLTNSNWSETDASNNAAVPNGWPEGMQPSGVNNTARADRGAIKRWYNWTVPTTTGGTTTNYTLTYGVAPEALVDKMSHVVNFNATCGASPTLNVNSLGATPIHYFNGATWAVVPSGMIKSGMTLEVAYNSSAGTYRIVSSAAPVVAQSAATAGYTTIPGATPILIQWGTSNTLSALGGSQSITFSVAFSASPYSIQVTGTNSNDSPGYVNTASTTGFGLVNPGPSNSAYYWQAIGPA